MKSLNERLYHLELLMESGETGAEDEAKSQNLLDLWWKGTYVRFCPNDGDEQQQGNSSTSVVRASHSLDNA